VKLSAPTRSPPGRTATQERAASPPPAAGAFDDYVVTTTRQGRSRIDNAPAVQVLSRIELDRLTPDSVGAAVERTPGVWTFGPAGVFNLNPSIRGLSGRRVQLLIDGNRIISEKNMGVTGYFVDMEQVRAIEVVRGPGSVLYGSDAIAGVINVLTRDPFAALGLHGGAALSGSTNNGEVMGAVWSHYATKRWYVDLALRSRNADEYQSGNGQTVWDSQYSDTSLAWAVGLRSGGQRLRLEARHYFGRDIGKAHNDRDIDREAGNGRHIFFPRDDSQRFTLRYRGDFEGRLKRIDASIFVHYTHRDKQVDRHLLVGNDPDGTTDLPVLGDRVLQLNKVGDLLNLGGQAHLVVDLGRWGGRLTLGFDGFYRLLDQEETSIAYQLDLATQKLVALPPSTTVYYDGAQMAAGGLFVQNRWAPHPRVALTLGARADLVHASVDQVLREGRQPEQKSNTDAALSGSLGLLVKLAPKLSLAVNGGRAFRAPTLQEKYLETVTCFGTQLGNPALKPEYGWSADVGLKGNLLGLRFETYVFATFLENMIGLDTVTSGAEAGSLRYGNRQRARLFGVELVAQRSFSLPWQKSRLTPFVSASWVRGDNLERDEPLERVPPLRLRGGLRFSSRLRPVVNRWFVEAELEHSLAQDRVATDESTTGAYTVLALRAGVRLAPFAMTRGAQLMIKAENVTDQAYRAHLALSPAIGRNVRMVLRLHY
ncbi:MAG: hypothetical protein CSA65_02120, partial [Proteobacteria bacterium]